MATYRTLRVRGAKLSLAFWSAPEPDASRVRTEAPAARLSADDADGTGGRLTQATPASLPAARRPPSGLGLPRGHASTPAPTSRLAVSASAASSSAAAAQQPRSQLVVAASAMGAPLYLTLALGVTALDLTSASYATTDPGDFALLAYTGQVWTVTAPRAARRSPLAALSPHRSDMRTRRTSVPRPACA